MKFEIENFYQFKGEGKAKASFSVKTEGGMYYDCKLVEGGSTGFFVVSGQSREYDKRDGGKGYANAFGALRDTPAAKFFDDVASMASGMLKVQETMNEPAPSNEPPPFNPDDDIPF